MSYRVLETGSRVWTYRGAVNDGILFAVTGPGLFLNYWEITVIHGDCPTGADQFADEYARAMGFNVEAYPGRNFPSFAARNQHMVDLGADVCLAFAKDWASGTGQTARMARKAGIPTIDYGVDTRREAAPVRHRGGNG